MINTSTQFEISTNSLPKSGYDNIAKAQDKAVKSLLTIVRSAGKCEDLYSDEQHMDMRTKALNALVAYSITAVGMPQWDHDKVRACLHKKQPSSNTPQEGALTGLIWGMVIDKTLPNQTWGQLCEKIEPLARAVILAANKAKTDTQPSADGRCCTIL